MSIKKSLFTAFFLLLFSEIAFASEFCDGFKEGWLTAYNKTHAPGGLKPLLPLCPLQPLKGFDEKRTDYEIGYSTGLEQGGENVHKDGKKDGAK